MNYHIGRLVLSSLCVGAFGAAGFWWCSFCRLQPANEHHLTQRTENKTTDVEIHQHSRRLLKMDILMSETCWAHNKWNKVASYIKLVFHSSTIAMMHGPINIRFISSHVCSYLDTHTHTAKVFSPWPMGCLSPLGIFSNSVSFALRSKWQPLTWSFLCFRLFPRCQHGVVRTTQHDVEWGHSKRDGNSAANCSETVDAVASDITVTPASADTVAFTVPLLTYR